MACKRIAVSNEVQSLLDECIDDYLAHHKEMRQIKISRNKIIYEIAKFYLKH